MNRTFLSFTFLATALVSSSSIGSAFTEEQLREIEALIESKREEIRQEVIEELQKGGGTGLYVMEATESRAGTVEQELDSITLPRPAMKRATRSIPGLMNKFTESQASKSSKPEQTGSYKVEASTASSTASISFGRLRSYTDIESDLERYSSRSFKISAPTDKKKDYTNISSLDGLASSFKFSYSYFKWTGQFPDFDADNNMVFEKDKDWFYGMNATLGYEEFKYFGQDFSKKKDEENPWSLGISGGFMPTGKGKNSSYAMGLTYQNTYKEADSITKCPAPVDEMPVECSAGSFMSPANKKKLIEHFEARSQFKLRKDSESPKDVAMVFRVSHDLRNDETGIDVPIYLIRDKDAALSGGVRLGWTDTDDLSFGVFVGSGFKWLDF